MNTSRRGTGSRSRRQAAPRRAFTSTLKSLEGLASLGAKVSVHVVDLDRGTVVLSGDDFVAYPIAGVGAVPILLEVAVAFRDGRLDPDEQVRRSDVDPPSTSGLWDRLRSMTLSLADVAVLCAAVGDPLATNALLGRVGLPAVQERIASLGFERLAVLDAHRDSRGPDDAPYLAVGTTRETATLMSMIANGRAVDATVSAQVGEWLTSNTDLTLVGAGTGLDPFAHDDDKHRLLFFNKTGHDTGVRAEAGVLAGPRAGVAYAITVCFDDLTIAHRLRVHDAIRVFGVDLMEYAY